MSYFFYYKLDIFYAAYIHTLYYFILYTVIKRKELSRNWCWVRLVTHWGVMGNVLYCYIERQYSEDADFSLVTYAFTHPTCILVLIKTRNDYPRVSKYYFCIPKHDKNHSTTYWTYKWNLVSTIFLLYDMNINIYTYNILCNTNSYKIYTHICIYIYTCITYNT